MRENKLITLIGIILLLCPLLSSAGIFEECMSRTQRITTASTLNCVNEEHAEVDKKLNASYAQLLKLLDARGKKSLRQAERSWLKFRHDECVFSGNPMAGGSGETELFSGCLLEMTKERLAMLDREVAAYSPDK